MKIAVITGASSGMGREAVFQIADRFSGIDEIWMVARRKDRLEELDGRVPVTLRCFGIDITREEELEELAQELEERKPDVKFLVNAAGFGKIGNVGEVAVDTELAMVRLNCEALCAVTHMVLPYMSGNSRIIQFASLLHSSLNQSLQSMPPPNFSCSVTAGHLAVN